MTLITFKHRTKPDFYETVCNRVWQQFEADGHHDKYATRLILIKGLVFGGMAIGSYTLILMNIFPPLVMLALGVFTGLGLLGFLLNVAHDAAHGALFKSAWLNRLLYLITFHLVGINGYLWHKRHLNSHHIFPNINGCDTDIDNNPILRFSPNAPYKPWFRFQHWYAPLVYLIVQIHAVFYKDFLHLGKKDLANMHNITHPWYEYLFFGLGKLIHVSVFLIIPYLVLQLPLWQIALGYFVMSAINSVLFVMCFAGTHFADYCIFPTRPEDDKIPLTYAEHAMLASLDWNVKDPWSHFMVGGINAHAAHHLFPHVCHVHYPEITRIIITTAKEFGIPYNETTLWGMVKSHFRLLKKLSVPTDNPDLPNANMLLQAS